MKKKIIAALGAAAAIAGVIVLIQQTSLGSDDSAGNTPGSTAMTPPAPSVPVAEVVTREITPSTDFTGYLEAPQAVALRSRVGGAIDAVSVPEGRLVTKGQLLFQIDPRPFQVSLDTAKAQLRQAEVLATQAESDFVRAERLVSTGAVSKQESEDAATRHKERQSLVHVAKAAIEAADLDLSYSRVIAPISGRVDRVLVTEGNLVGPSTLLTTIVSVDPVHALFDIDESTYLDFAARARQGEDGSTTTGFRVQVGLMTDKDFPHEGVLDFLGNRVDRSSGTVRARAVIPNPEGRLTPGLFARTRLATSVPRPAILIDDQAVGIDQGRTYVLVLGAGDQVEYRPVELGPVVHGLRVVSAGLKTGETIIVKGLVRPGMQVSPQRISMQSPPNEKEESR